MAIDPVLGPRAAARYAPSSSALEHTLEMITKIFPPRRLRANAVLAPGPEASHARRTDIAETVALALYLASDAAREIDGEIWRVESGLRARDGRRR